MLRSVIVVGAEGTGTHFVCTTLSSILKLPVCDYHTWMFKPNSISIPAIFHVSYPNGRSFAFHEDGVLLLSERHWPSLETLKLMAGEDAYIVKCSRDARDAISSAFRRFYLEYDLTTNQNVNIAINSYYMACGILTKLPIDYCIDYDEAVSDPQKTFADAIDFLGEGEPLEDYNVVKLEYPPFDDETESKLKYLEPWR